MYFPSAKLLTWKPGNAVGLEVKRFIGLHHHNLAFTV